MQILLFFFFFFSFTWPLSLSLSSLYVSQITHAFFPLVRLSLSLWYFIFWYLKKKKKAMPNFWFRTWLFRTFGCLSYWVFSPQKTGFIHFVPKTSRFFFFFFLSLSQENSLLDLSCTNVIVEHIMFYVRPEGRGGNGLHPQKERYRNWEHFKLLK